jgi:hypothetical protein
MWWPRQKLRLRMRLSTLIFLSIICGLSLTLVIQQRRTPSPPVPARIPSPVRIARALPPAQLRIANDMYAKAAAERAKAEAANSAVERAIRLALDRPLDMPFPAGTTLDNLFLYIRRLTVNGSLREGIPTRVDQIGLQEAGVTMAVPLTLSTTNIPLKTTIAEVLSRLDLDYVVHNGFLEITSKESADKPLAAALPH